MAEIEKHPDFKGELACFGVCEKCNIIYKAHLKDLPADGIHRCRECGTEINVRKLK